MTDHDKRQSTRLPARFNSVWSYIAVVVTLHSLVAILVPGSIAANAFLQSFLPHEYLETLIVLVTITLASIVNIHVKLTVMTQASGAQSPDEPQVASMRRKANSVARFLMVITLAAVSILIVDGSLPQESLARAWTFSGLLSVFFGAIIATYEVQRIVMSLSELPDSR